MDTNKESDFVNDELAALAEVEAITSLAGKTIYAYEREGKFPTRVKIGSRTAWVRREVYGWVRARIDARPAQPVYLPIIPRDPNRPPKKRSLRGRS